MLFVGATRPPMRWGVTYAALMLNLVFTMEAFLVTRNLLTILVCMPIHGVCALLCARDPRFFELVALWGRTRLPAALTTLRLLEGEQLQRSGPRPSGCRRPTPITDVRLGTATATEAWR